MLDSRLVILKVPKFLAFLLLQQHLMISRTSSDQSDGDGKKFSTNIFLSPIGFSTTKSSRI